MAQIEYRDVTGVFIYFTQEQITELFSLMSQEQLRFSRVLAETIQKPHEIWQLMREDETVKGQWYWVRSYVQFLNLSETDIDAAFGVAVMKFAYLSRWELESCGLVLGDEESVMQKVNEEVRNGRFEYSANQH